MLGVELEQKIVRGIYTWGYYPVLHYLKEQEESENFEICSLIKKALDQVGEGRDWYLSSQTTELSSALKNQTDTYINNVDYYIEGFKKYMLK